MTFAVYDRQKAIKILDGWIWDGRMQNEFVPIAVHILRQHRHCGGDTYPINPHPEIIRALAIYQRSKRSH